MPHTPEQRDKHPLCGAMTKRGVTCRAFAGQGTDHLGIGCCKNHGGATRSHARHAVKVEAKRRMVMLGEPVLHAQPHEALLALLRATAGHVAWLHRQVAQLTNLDSLESRVTVELYDNERDRLTRIAKACSDVGVSEREIRIHEHEAALFSIAVEAALEEHGLNGEQRRLVHQSIAAQLETVEGTAEDLDHLLEPGAIFAGGHP